MKHFNWEHFCVAAKNRWLLIIRQMKRMLWILLIFINTLFYWFHHINTHIHNVWSFYQQFSRFVWSQRTPRTPLEVVRVVFDALHDATSSVTSLNATVFYKQFTEYAWWTYLIKNLTYSCRFILDFFLKWNLFIWEPHYYVGLYIFFQKCSKPGEWILKQFCYKSS